MNPSNLLVTGEKSDLSGRKPKRKMERQGHFGLTSKRSDRETVRAVRSLQAWTLVHGADLFQIFLNFL
jgi:hypothetical protein